jgi:CDP-diacylglycerol--glycerol-3-phosphate 3-phosphatidyltransferase
LIIIGALFNRMAPVLWIAAVISTITVIHRIVYTYQQSKILQEALATESQVQAQSQGKPQPAITEVSPATH